MLPACRQAGALNQQEVTLEWFIKEPDIFLKNPNVLLNENIPPLCWFRVEP